MSPPLPRPGHPSTIAPADDCILPANSVSLTSASATEGRQDRAVPAGPSSPRAWQPSNGALSICRRCVRGGWFGRARGRGCGLVLTSTYEPGHRPLHVAAPAVALRRAGTRSAAWISACSREIPAPSTGHRRSASRRPGLAARSDSVLVLFASADVGRRRARPPEPQRPGRVHGAGAGRLRNDVGAAQWLGRWTGMVVRSGWAACPMLAVPAVVAFA
jgi:hypothetical protein